MAIKGVQRAKDGSSDVLAQPYIPEQERALTDEPQTVFWIKPKDTRASNRTLQRYAGTGKDRRGYRDLNIRKLNNADEAEWLDLVVKIENYTFSNQYPDLNKMGNIPVIDSPEIIRQALYDLPSDVIIEVFDASADSEMLTAGLKNVLTSSSTTSSGKTKTK